MSDALVAQVVLTVPFHDVDPAGLVWHGNYFRYFEQARCALLETLQYNYRHMAESGLIWPLIDVSSRFRGAIGYHQQITVQARLVEWEYRMVFEYSILDEQGKELATGRTVQVPMRMDTREMVIGTNVFALQVQKALTEQGEHR